MHIGTTGMDCEITLAFHQDGTPSGLRGIKVEGVELPTKLARELWNYLSALKPADDVIDAAWYEAEPEAEAV